MPNDRIVSHEIKTIRYSVPCKCGKGNMVATGSVRLISGTYEHHHNCVFFGKEFHKTGCGLEEWFPVNYPYKEEVEMVDSADSILFGRGA